MRLTLNSRFYQMSFVAASLMFVIWLSFAMWLDAFDQRQNARGIQSANQQEIALFELGDSIGEERQLAYELFSQKDINLTAIDRLIKLSEKVTSQAENQAGVMGITGSNHPTASKMDHGNSHGQQTEKQPEISGGSIQGKHSQHMTTVSGNVEPMTPKSHNAAADSTLTGDIQPTSQLEDMGHDAAHRHSDKSPLTTVRRLSNITQLLTVHRQELYAQLQQPRNQRDPTFGMFSFHEYTSIVEVVNKERRLLNIAPWKGNHEFYIHAKMKDTLWIFRESLLQISALIEGIVAMAETTADMAQTRHHADMLMALNVRLDLAWDEVLKISNNSDSVVLEEQAQLTAVWYANNFKSLSSSLAASSRYNDVTLNELRGWLSNAQQLLLHVDKLRADALLITLQSVVAIERKATVNLALVSLLVLFSLGTSLASMYFFRRTYKQAHRDELTGLENRRMFCLNLDNFIASTRQSDDAFGMLMIDLDRFKYVNDSLGHAAGDRLLQDVSERIKSIQHPYRSLARLGGDEFAILLKTKDAAQLREVAKSVCDELKRPFYIDGATVNIGSSIGTAQYPQDASARDDLINAADLAMYCAKKSGTNQCMEYNKELDQSMASTARLVNDLQLAVQNEQFELYYQPQFNLAQGKVLSVEALIRWNHPERGLVSPNDFIPVAEENGLMPAIGNWVLNEACRQAAFWLHEKSIPLRVAVNISADHFFQPDFVNTIFQNLETHNLPPQLLELEVTETVAVNDMSLVVDSLVQLREASIQVALDDFGTGYSSLSYLQDLPLDTLKIDKSFIQKMLLGNLQHDSITETIVTLGQSLKLETVAEGVETADQLSAVSDMKISVVQGYFYSKPVSASELEQVVLDINMAHREQKAA